MHHNTFSCRTGWQPLAHALLMLMLCITLAACDDATTDANGDDPDPDPDPEPDPVVPAAPENLESLSDDSQITLDWSEATDAESYSVYRATSSGDAMTGTPQTEGLTETTFTDTDVENGTTYYYQVTATADEEGDPSDEVEVTPFPEPPSDRP